MKLPVIPGYSRENVGYVTHTGEKSQQKESTGYDKVKTRRRCEARVRWATENKTQESSK